MFVGEIYRQLFGEATNIRLLDLCAAPGGKTTLYSTAVGMTGLVVANEPIRSRAMTLADNVRRWGLGNVAVTCNDPEQIGAYEQFFDVVAIDAPCSGEGMFRKDAEARNQWSLSNVEKCAARQKRIIAEGWKSLRPGGVLIYSTCTFNHFENEDIIAWVASNFDCEDAGTAIDPSWNIIETETDGIKGFHFYPHLTRGEGFFATAIRKGDGKAKIKTPKARKEPFKELQRRQFTELQQWVAQPEQMRFMQVGEDQMYGYYKESWNGIRTLAEGLNMIYSGVCMGQLFNDKLRPDHSLALFHDLNRKNVTVAELNTEDALNYLRKRDFCFDTLREGLNLICQNGVAIGWSKRIGNRVNTLLPNSFRIMNL